MNKLFLPIALVLSLGACSKSDKKSPAPDVADAYIGNWLVTDTVESTAPGSATHYYSTVASVSKLSSNKAKFTNFFSYACTNLDADVTATSIAINDTTCIGADHPLSFVGFKNGDTITFSYSLYVTGPIYNNVRGTAVKQP